MANAEITVSIEAALSKALMKFAQEFFNEHGVMIRGVQFDWREYTTIDSNGGTVNAVEVSSKSIAGW